MQPYPTQRVLFVGAERPDEFVNALRLANRGHKVIVVNPRRTSASRAFQSQGGRFIPAGIEQLPPASGPFHLIREHYPYPLRQYSEAAKTFALARLMRLAPCGRWVLFTESPRFATALKALAD